MSKIIKPFGAPHVVITLNIDGTGQVQVSGTRMGVLMTPLDMCATMSQVVTATLMQLSQRKAVGVPVVVEEKTDGTKDETANKDN